MIVTIDLDSMDWVDISSTISLSLSYKLKLLRVSKSYSRQGYHVVVQLHRGRLQDIDFILNSPAELVDLVKRRLEIAEKAGIRDKLSLLRAVLGDDINRILYDINKRPLPSQVLFSRYRWYMSEVVRWSLKNLRKECMI